MEPTTTGFVDTEGLHLAYDVYGAGEPLVLLHGGVLNTEDLVELIPLLASRFQVIALDQQGHGRSSDTARAIEPEGLARDVVALLDHLGIERAHVVGHSMGGAVALVLAMSHGSRVLSVVPMSITVRPEGAHPDLRDPAAFATSDRMPTQDDFAWMQATYARLSPTPDGFDAFMAKMQGGEQFYVGWTDEELARISCPVLLVIGDHDFTTVEHLGFMLEHVPGSTGAVLPGCTHMAVTHKPSLLVPILLDFLAS